MANNALSLLTTAQALLTNKYSNPEMRHKEWAITKALLKNRDIMIPDYKTLQTSDSRAVEAYAFIKRASDPVTTRHATGAAVAASFTDTQKVTLTWATKGQLFKTSLKMADRNFATAAQMAANALESAWINLMDVIETLNAAWLATNKSQAQGASDGELGAWNPGTFVWEVDAAKQKWFFQYVQAMMNINNYSDMIDFIADPVAYAIYQQVYNQGTGNSINTQFTVGNLNMLQSTALAPVAGYSSYGYLIPDGSAGMLTWIPRVNRENVITRLETYTNMTDPFGYGIQAAIQKYEAKVDNSALGGEKQDENTYCELTVDIAGVKAPLSVANETTIFQAALLS